MAYSQRDQKCISNALLLLLLLIVIASCYNGGDVASVFADAAIFVAVIAAAVSVSSFYMSVSVFSLHLSTSVAVPIMWY